MHVITHFLTGWTLSLPFNLDERDRNLIVCASIAPDLDGLAVLGDLVQGKPLDSCDLYATYHHLLCHNVVFAIIASLLLGYIARKKLLVGLLALISIHIHFLADIVGSGGPDGSQWEIPYFAPFSTSWSLVVSWQWALNAWPNILFTVAMIAMSLHIAWSRGFSPVGFFSRRADRALVSALRKRFGCPNPR